MKEIKTQVITAIGLIITAAAALLISNMEALFNPEEKVPVVIQEVTNIPSNIKDTLVITKTVIQKPVKKEREIDW